MNIIETLNNITIDDLKNIDRNQIKEAVMRRPDISINILLIAVTLYATMFIYNSSKNKAKDLQSEAVELKEKLKVVNEATNLRKEYSDFIKAFPETITIDELSNKLSELALKHDVQILFFTPGGKTKTDFNEITSIKLRITSNDYANIIYFIKAIENSSFSITIERWNGETLRNTASRGHEEEYQVQIEANVELNLFSLVNP